MAASASLLHSARHSVILLDPLAVLPHALYCVFSLGKHFSSLSACTLSKLSRLSSPRAGSPWHRTLYTTELSDSPRSPQVPEMLAILRNLWAVLAVIAFLLIATSQGRRLIVHCTRVLLNGKNPIRWLIGLLAGVLPPVMWTLAFKLARNIPSDWRPEVSAVASVTRQKQSNPDIAYPSGPSPLSTLRFTLICYPSWKLSYFRPWASSSSQSF